MIILKNYLDNALIRSFASQNTEEHSLKLGLEHLDIELTWSSLLELLHQESLLESLPPFNAENPLFKHIISRLALSLDQHDLFDLYDQLFVECLTLVKSLPQIRRDFLLAEIRQLTQLPSCFSASLAHFEGFLTDHPSKAMHDIMLYLAWDRMCVYLAMIFESAPGDPNSLESLRIFKECLVESFLHIKNQGKTNPVFFRLVEALYAYLMREENLQNYDEADWLILCQSAQVLRPREQLPDVPYIDISNPAKIYTLDPPEKVRITFSLTTLLSKMTKDQFLIPQPEIIYSDRGTPSGLI